MSIKDDDIPEGVEILVADWKKGDVKSSIKKYVEASEVIKKLGELKELFRNDILIYLKERNWDSYKDKDSDINVKITVVKKQSIDKKQLTAILSEGQMAQIMQVKTIERLDIVTPETRKRLKKYVRPKKASKG